MTNSFEDPRIEDYVLGRLNAIEKADFEADMMVDKELELAVAHRFLMKIRIERKVKEHIENEALPEVYTPLSKSFIPQKNKDIENAKPKWGNLFELISSN